MLTRIWRRWRRAKRIASRPKYVVIPTFSPEPRYLVSLTQTQLDNLAKAAHASLVCEVLTGFPMLLSIGQWADESGWGEHSPGNNCFGIKYYPGASGMQWSQTAEYINGKRVGEKQAFATFPDLTSCFRKHALLIMDNSAYHAAYDAYLMGDKDVFLLAKDIAPIYATDPEYATKICSIMAMPEVRAAVTKELATAGNSPT